MILVVSCYNQESESYIVSLRSNCWWALLVDLFIGDCYFIFHFFFRILWEQQNLGFVAGEGVVVPMREGRINELFTGF